MVEREKQYSHREDSRPERDQSPSKPPRTKKPRIPFILTFIVAFATWIVLSGRFDLFHLTLGHILPDCGSFFRRPDVICFQKKRVAIAMDPLYPVSAMVALSGLSRKHTRYVPRISSQNDGSYRSQNYPIQEQTQSGNVPFNICQFHNPDSRNHHRICIDLW